MPVFQQKWESDANFERCTRFLLRNHPTSAAGARQPQRPLAGARHRRRAASRASPPNDFELQMLYGMADAEKQASSTRLGYRLRIYMPFGELIPGMAYLVRRLLENTSNDSFLESGVHRRHVSPEVLADESRRTRLSVTSRDRNPGVPCGNRADADDRRRLSQRAADRFRRRPRTAKRCKRRSTDVRAAVRPALSAGDRRPRRSRRASDRRRSIRRTSSEVVGTHGRRPA